MSTKKSTTKKRTAGKEKSGVEMAKKKISKSWLTFLEQFTEMIELMGFDKTCEVLSRVKAGERPAELQPLINFYVKRHQKLPKAIRAAHTRKARRYAAQVRAMKERGEL